MARYIDVNKLINEIEDFPTADVVAVVRCKECKYQDECLQKVDCEYLNREIFYCSYGEGKDKK